MRIRVVEAGEDPATVTFDEDTIAIIEPMRGGWRIFYADEDVDETGEVTREQAVEFALRHSEWRLSSEIEEFSEGGATD